MTKGAYWSKIVFPADSTVKFENERGIEVPRGTTEQRPSNPIGGEFRYNTTLGSLEVYQGGNWLQLSSSDSETGETVVSPTTATNTGIGIGLFKEKISNNLVFKSLVAGSNVNISQDSNNVTISANVPADTTIGSNIGVGTAQIYVNKSGQNLQFRSLRSTSNYITITNNGNSIDIGSTLAPYVVSSVGSGSTVYHGRIGNDLQFKTLSSGSGIALLNNSEETELEIKIRDNLIVPGTGSLTLPKGASEQRPTPITGMIRYNTSTSKVEAVLGSVWTTLLTENNGVLKSGDTMTGHLTMNAGSNITLNAGNLIVANGTLEVTGNISVINGGITLTNGDIELSGSVDVIGDISVTGTVDGRNLSNDGNVIDNITSLSNDAGFITKTGGSLVSRILTADSSNNRSGITLTNGTGTGNVVIGLNITDRTLTTQLADADELIIYDVSTNSNRKTRLSNLVSYLDIDPSMDITGQIATTVLSDSDELVLYDVSESVNRKTTIGDFISHMNIDTSMNITGLSTIGILSDTDEIAIYDFSDANNKKVTIGDLAEHFKYELETTGVVQGSYSGADITVDQYGRISHITDNTLISNLDNISNNTGFVSKSNNEFVTRTLSGSTGISITGGDGSQNVTIGLDLTGHTSTSVLNDSDELVIYDASASANRKTTIGDLVSFLNIDTTSMDIHGQQPLTSGLHNSSELAIYDFTTSSNRKTTVGELVSFLDIDSTMHINELASVSNLASNDELVLYDNSASDNRKTTINNLATFMNANILSVENIGILKSLTSNADRYSRVDTVVVHYHTTQGDGGGGIFVKDLSDTTSADNGGTIIVDANNTRWKRIYNEEIHGSWFGATLTGLTNNSSAVVTAIATATAEKKPLSMPKNYTPLSVSNGASLNINDLLMRGDICQLNTNGQTVTLNSDTPLPTGIWPGQRITLWIDSGSVIIPDGGTYIGSVIQEEEVFEGETRIVASGESIATQLAASSSGDRVLLERGGVWNGPSTLTIPAGVTLGVTGAYSDTANSSNNPHLINIRIEMQTGSKITKGFTDPWSIRQARQGNGGGTGISMSGVNSGAYVTAMANDIDIEYLDIRGLNGGASRHGIWTGEQSNIRIFKCFIDGEEGNGGDCISGGSFTKNGPVSDGNSVSYCILRNPGSNSGDAIHLNRQTNLYIGHNISTGVMSSMKGHIIIHPYGGKTGLETGMNIIEHNTCVGSGYGYGIESYHTNTTIRWNRIINTSGSTAWGGFWNYGDPNEFDDDQVNIIIHDNILDGFKFGFIWAHDDESWTTKLLGLEFEYNTIVNCNSSSNSRWFYTDAGVGEFSGMVTKNLAWNNGNNDQPIDSSGGGTITDNYIGFSTGDPLLDSTTYIPTNVAAQGYGFRSNLGTPGAGPEIQ